MSACQSGKSPSLAVITLSDPPPRLVGMDSTSIAGLAQKKWIIEVCVYMYACLVVCLQHSTPKAVTFPKKNELPRVHVREGEKIR